MTPLSVVIAEDSAVLRDGLVSLLTRRGHRVLSARPDADALLAELPTLTQLPDVAVLDVRMPPTFTDEGLRAALAIRRDHPGVGVLLFSQYVETSYATELFGSDARGTGYLLKDRVAEVRDFLDALERIAAGQTVLDPEVVGQLMGAARVDPGLARLSAREVDVLEMMAEGRSNAAIAERLFLSAGAVEKHVTSIFGKLDLVQDAGDNRRVLAVLRYLRLGA